MKLDLFLLIVIILVVLWLFGEVGGYGFGGLINILLLIAVIVVLYRFFTGRNVVTGK